MRVGWNPVKRMRRRGAARRVTVATVTFIPELAGFYAQSLDVLKLMFASLRANTGQPFDLLVFDNASCAEARQYLAEEHARGRIQYLVLASANAGMEAAHNFMFRAAPGEYIAYADSDMFFYPGWLEASLQVLEAFPKAGVVTATPVHHRSRTHTDSALAWARSEPAARLEEGKLIPREWIAGFCAGTGRDLERYLREQAAVQNYRLTFQDVRAYTGASAFQFVAPRAALQRTLPFSEEWLVHGSEDLFVRLDAQGYLTLATDGMYVHHLGNTLTAEWRDVAAQYGERPASRPLEPGSLAARLARPRLVRRALIRLYDALFRILYGG